MEKEKNYESEEEAIDIEDPETAREFIRECMEIKGDLPMVTVPIEYAEEARNGIKPHTTWIYDALIAGMLGRKPYMPDGAPRAIFRIKAKPEDVAPRFTGPDKHFHGVVVFRRPISPDLLEEIPA
jgi:hypothetical protein